MLRLPCPVCGLRDHAEFSYGGDATVARPELDDDDEGAWFDYLYPRDNPRGPHKEFWQHAHGCRQWLVVERDTFTNQVLSAALAPEGEA